MILCFDLSRRFKGEVKKVQKIRQDSGRLLIETPVVVGHEHSPPPSRPSSPHLLIFTATPASIRHLFRDLPIYLRFRSSSDVLHLMYHHPIITLYSLITRFRLHTCHRSITHHTDVAFTLFTYCFRLSFSSTILDFLIDPPRFFFRFSVALVIPFPFFVLLE